MANEQETKSYSQEDIECLSVILKTQELKDYEMAMGKFNPFKALKVDGYEVRHTTVLEWLLDVKGTHGLEDKFLVNFLEKISLIASDDSQNKISLINTNTKINDIKITPQAHFRDGQLVGEKGAATKDEQGSDANSKTKNNYPDILIEGEDFILVLEAKIKSKEGKIKSENGDQYQLDLYHTDITRYKDSLGKLGKVKKIFFLYLTVNKDQAGATLSDEDRMKSYNDWMAVSWLNLVATSLVEAIAKTDKEIIERNRPADKKDWILYERKFLLSYLDVIYEQSSTEFRENPPQKAIEDRDSRDEYLKQVNLLIKRGEYKESLIVFKDYFEGILRNTKGSESKKNAWKKSFFDVQSKLGKIIESDLTNSAEAKQLKKIVHARDFQSTFQFLLDQVDSTSETHLIEIKKIINDQNIFRIFPGRGNRVSFIPNDWNNLDKDNRLRFMVEYKQKGKIECKLYFLSTRETKKNEQGEVTTRIIDEDYLDWRKSLWNALKEKEPRSFGNIGHEINPSKKEKSFDHTPIFDGGDAKIINYEDGIKDFLSNFNNALNKYFEPVINLVSNADKQIKKAKVVVPQS